MEQITQCDSMRCVRTIVKAYTLKIGFIVWKKWPRKLHLGEKILTKN